MAKIRTQIRTLEGFAKEEDETYKDYMRRGFPSQARDEKRHATFFRKEANRRKKRR